VCFRGGLIDLYPMGSALPYRLDLDDDVVDAIKTFDVDTQRTLYAVKEIRMLPAREFPLDEPGRARFRSRWRELFEGDPSKKRLYRDVSNGVPAAGVEYYLPLFFDSVATIFDYLPAGHARAARRRERGGAGFLARDATRHKMAGGDPGPAAARAAASSSCRRRSSSSGQGLPRIDCCIRRRRKPVDPLVADPLPPSRSTGARTIRSPR
jgi:transcription-repair coupling factor (superfamily II helicase)